MDRLLRCCTGGGAVEQGIGGAVCRTGCARQGYHVCLAGRTQYKIDRMAHGPSRERGGQAEAVLARDATDAAQVAACYDPARESKYRDSQPAELGFNAGKHRRIDFTAKSRPSDVRGAWGRLLRGLRWARGGTRLVRSGRVYGDLHRALRPVCAASTAMASFAGRNKAALRMVLRRRWRLRIGPAGHPCAM